MSLIKIVSGGQTGVDRGALDAALAARFPCGGWCPGDRSAEDGPIPERYPMSPLPGEYMDARTPRPVGGQYRQRTLQNVQDSNGTAILFSQTLSGGTKFTRDLCIREKKPFVVLDATQISEAAAAAAIVRFVEENEIQVLNVAGPRANGWPEGYAFALGVVGGVIGRWQVPLRRPPP
ncbi:MAG: putative molybdenum carrier protein [Steroidobacteraceae bacterium]